MAMRLLRRLLMWLANAECPGPSLCRPVTEHGPGPDFGDNHSIRSVCLICGKKTSWNRVLGPF